MSPNSWNVIGQALDFGSGDAQFWWATTASILGTMLETAGYDLHRQYSILLFYFRFIIPYLGPRPRATSAKTPTPTWKSFMTDDYSPLELSWAWDSIKAAPKVRFSIEAIGPHSGTRNDPFNQSATLALVDALKLTYTHLSWGMFDYFWSNFRPPSLDTIGYTVGKGNNFPHRSSLGMGFDFSGGRVNVAAYFTPPVHIPEPAAGWNYTYKAITGFESEGVKFPTAQQLHYFLGNTEVGKELKFVGLGIDCVETSKSRLKVYFRSQVVCRRTICKILTLNDTLPTPWDGPTVERLFSLLNKITPNLEAKLPSGHQTAGFLYNFDIHSGRKAPYPRIYIPVKHHGNNDLQVAQGLLDFRSTQGRPDTEDHYIAMLRRICTHRPLEDAAGLQTYIAISPKEGSLAMAAYVTPQVYSRLEQPAKSG